MDVILLESIHKLGKMGAKVSVKSGYGRNYLIPQGKALPATEVYLAEFERRRVELERIEAEKLAHAKARHAILDQLAVKIEVRCGDEGKLFGSVGTTDIVDAVLALGHTIERAEIRLPSGPIRQIGVFAIEVDLGSDVKAILNVTVESDRPLEDLKKSVSMGGTFDLDDLE